MWFIRVTVYYQFDQSLALYSLLASLQFVASEAVPLTYLTLTQSPSTSRRERIVQKCFLKS